VIIAHADYSTFPWDDQDHSNHGASMEPVYPE